MLLFYTYGVRNAENGNSQLNRIDKSTPSFWGKTEESPAWLCARIFKIHEKANFYKIPFSVFRTPFSDR